MFDAAGLCLDVIEVPVINITLNKDILFDRLSKLINRKFVVKEE